MGESRKSQYSTLAELDEAFRQISDEFRTQYLLAYYPSQKITDSEFRRIQVRIHGASGKTAFNVRHRTGYYSHRPE